MLSTQGKKNIIATKDVTGEVTADLYGVTFKEALDAVLTSTGFAYEQKGNLIQVMTIEQKAAIVAARRKTKVKVFHLSYITAVDAKALIAPILSSEATVSITPAASTGIPTSVPPTSHLACQTTSR